MRRLLKTVAGFCKRRLGGRGGMNSPHGIDRSRHGDVTMAKPPGVMRGERDGHAIVDVAPFGMMIDSFGMERHPRHKAEGGAEIGEDKLARKGKPIRPQPPVRQSGKSRIPLPVTQACNRHRALLGSSGPLTYRPIMPPSMHDGRVAAHELACRRGDRLLFRGVTLSLEPGEALQLTGFNGIGKSSLIRILAGLLRPFAGHVARVGAVGLLDERAALDPQLPLGRALGFWRRIDGPAADALARLGLDRLTDVPVRYLSTGQTKRAALARLIGQHAPIWLLDEPLNGLDAEAVRLVEALAAEHGAAGGICVVASHQPFTHPAMRRLALADFAA